MTDNIQQVDDTETIDEAEDLQLGSKKHNIRFDERAWLDGVAKMERIGGSMSRIFHAALAEFLRESDRESALRHETRMAEHYRTQEQA